MSHIKTKIPTRDYIGQTIDEMRRLKTTGTLGLLGNLIHAKVEADQVLRTKMEVKKRAEVTEIQQLEAELTRDALIEFLTHPDLHWTISAMKAAISVEEMRTTGPLLVKVDTAVNTAVNTTVSPGITTAGTWTNAGITIGKTVDPGIGVGKGLGTGVGKGTGTCTEPMKLRKTGARHGAMLVSRGYAYIGQDPQATDFQANETKNDFTKVKLYYE